MVDQHDETRILRKLFVLATNPYVASKVQTILHRCHLPTPELFQELPFLQHDDWISYPTHKQTGRQHYGTYIRLVLQAVANMVNVHTLRIVLGHCGLTQALIWGFFGPHREANVSVRKLWLESCCVQSPDYHDIWTPLDFSQVESLRLRRLWFQFLPTLTSMSNVPAGASHKPLFISAYSCLTLAQSDCFKLLYPGAVMWLTHEIGRVGYYYTHESYYSTGMRNPTAGYYDANILYAEKPWVFDHPHYAERTFQSIMSHAPSVSFVRFILSLAMDRTSNCYVSNCTDLEPDFESIRSAFRVRSLDSALRLLAFRPQPIRNALCPRGKLEPSLTDSGFSISVKGEVDDLGAWQNFRLDRAYFNESSCLTSLTFDWVIFQQGHLGLGHERQPFAQGRSVLSRLCNIIFPNLQVFQMRNCITGTTHLGPDIFLFAAPLGPDKELIDFLEAHMNLRCLAWPMAHFFPSDGVSAHIADRVSRITTNFGRTLTDLRVDAMLTNAGEPSTDSAQSMHDLQSRRSRRLFITEFAAHMRVLESIKMEGGVPRDEKRETTRALRHCPLTKLVHIGASFPLGNTWGEDGRYLREHDDESVSYMTLEEEDEDMLQRAMLWNSLTSKYNNDRFSARFGRDHEPALYTIASHHANTIRELKFCGYNGAPMLR